MISFSHFSSSYLVAPSSHLSGPQIDSRFCQPSSCIRDVLMSEPRRFIFILVDDGVSCLNFTNPSPSHRFFVKVLYTGTCVCICTQMYFFATPQRLVIFFSKPGQTGCDGGSSLSAIHYIFSLSNEQKPKLPSPLQTTLFLNHHQYQQIKAVLFFLSSHELLL